MHGGAGLSVVAPTRGWTRSVEKACADQMAKFVSACWQAQHKLAESLHKNVRIFFNVCDFDKWMSGLLLRARCWKFPWLLSFENRKSILIKSSLICHLVLLVFTQKFEILGTVLNVNFLVNEVSFWIHVYVWPGIEMACKDVFVFSSLTKLEVRTCLPITWVGHGIHLHVQVQGCTDFIFLVT